MFIIFLEVSARDDDASDKDKLRYFLSGDGVFNPLHSTDDPQKVTRRLTEAESDHQYRRLVSNKNNAKNPPNDVNPTEERESSKSISFGVTKSDGETFDPNGSDKIKMIKTSNEESPSIGMSDHNQGGHRNVGNDSVSTTDSNNYSRENSNLLDHFTHSNLRHRQNAINNGDRTMDQDEIFPTKTHMYNHFTINEYTGRVQLIKVRILFCK